VRTNQILRPEVEVEPLGDMILDFLISRNREEAFVDFKETMDISRNAPFAKIAKDIFAFSNNGGGFIFLGFKEKAKMSNPPPDEKSNFLPIGLSESFHIDQADLQTKFNAYANIPIEIGYREFIKRIDETDKRFAAIFIPASTCVLTPIKNGDFIDENGKLKQAFVTGSVLIRRGTQSLPARDDEIEWIKRRSLDRSYRLSVLSGKEDYIPEELYSNLFRVIKSPKHIWVATIKNYNAFRTAAFPNIVQWQGKIISFREISKSSPFWNGIYQDSIAEDDLITWLNDPDKQKVIIWLLNDELGTLAKTIGLEEEERKHKFYFICDGEQRIEKWTTRQGRQSSPTVAKKIWAQQLNGYVYWHSAVIARFRYINGKVLLRMSPSFQLTSDGYRPVFGPKEGTVITKLTYNRYNDSYLNSILFWASKFSRGKDMIGLAENAVQIASTPITCRINVGIASDKPVKDMTYDFE